MTSVGVVARNQGRRPSGPVSGVDEVIPFNACISHSMEKGHFMTLHRTRMPWVETAAHPGTGGIGPLAGVGAVVRASVNMLCSSLLALVGDGAACSRLCGQAPSDVEDGPRRPGLCRLRRGAAAESTGRRRAPTGISTWIPQESLSGPEHRVEAGGLRRVLQQSEPSSKQMIELLVPHRKHPTVEVDDPLAGHPSRAWPTDVSSAAPLISARLGKSASECLL